MANKTNLKTYFETGNIPKQSQYADLIDSNLNLQETETQILVGTLSSSNLLANKFQAYNVDYSDPANTSVVVYHLHDTANVPLFGGETYSLQPTFKRTVDLSNSVFTDEYFDPISVKLGDLSTYPVTHITTNVYPPFYIFE